MIGQKIMIPKIFLKISGQELLIRQQEPTVQWLEPEDLQQDPIVREEPKGET